MNKKCIICDEVKDLFFFFKRSKKKDGFDNRCKICVSKISEKSYFKHKSARNLKHKEWLFKNKEYCKEYNKDYCLKNLDQIKIKRKNYKRLYYEKNKQYVINKCKDYYYKNRHRIRQRVKNYYFQNRNKIIRNQLEYVKNRLKNNIRFKLGLNLRARIRFAIKNNSKKGSSINLLGCSVENFKKYIESLWKPGMSWNNWGNSKGKWQIDHVIPCMAFNLINSEEQKRCFNYKNQQPIWYEDHLLKTANDRRKFM